MITTIAQRIAFIVLLGALPLSAKDYNVIDFGASNDASVLATSSIQRAIDVCARDGGGRVVVPPGQYLISPLFLKSNVEFHLMQGASLLGSTNPEDYPTVWTRVAGIEMDWLAALINIRGRHNVTLSGNGTINGRGNEYFWPLYWKMQKEYTDKGLRWVVDYDVPRPLIIQVYNSENVVIRDLHLERSAFWTCHIVYSKNILVDGLTIRNNIDGVPEQEGFGPSTDGVNMDSSSDVIVQNCDIDCNDDNITLKSGRDSDGIQVNLPTENIIIRNNIARRGMGMFTCGSETSGSIRNVQVYNNKAIGTIFGIRFKSARTRGGVVEAIDIYDNQMEGVKNPIKFESNWFPAYSYGEVLDDAKDYPPHWYKLAEPVPPSVGLPFFRNISIRNLVVKACPEEGLEIYGLPDAPIRNIYFENVMIEAASPGVISNAENIIFRNVSFSTPLQAQPIEKDHTANILWLSHPN
jgi:polygalacturonase